MSDANGHANGRHETREEFLDKLLAGFTKHEAAIASLGRRLDALEAALGGPPALELTDEQLDRARMETPPAPTWESDLPDDTIMTVADYAAHAGPNTKALADLFEAKPGTVRQLLTVACAMLGEKPRRVQGNGSYGGAYPVRVLRAVAGFVAQGPTRGSRYDRNEMIRHLSKAGR